MEALGYVTNATITIHMDICLVSSCLDMPCLRRCWSGSIFSPKWRVMRSMQPIGAPKIEKDPLAVFSDFMRSLIVYLLYVFLKCFECSRIWTSLFSVVQPKRSRVGHSLWLFHTHLIDCAFAVQATHRMKSRKKQRLQLNGSTFSSGCCYSLANIRWQGTSGFPVLQ